MLMSCSPVLQFVFKTESFAASSSRTVHEELAKAMTAILKPSTDFLTSNKLLKVRLTAALHTPPDGEPALCSSQVSVPVAEIHNSYNREILNKSTNMQKNS